MNEMKYLGFVITQNGLTTDPGKVQAVQSFPIPTNRTELKGFLGLANYYRRFVKNFSTIAEPLNRLTKKDQEYEWKQEQTEAFNQIKEKLTQQPVLARANFQKEFTLYTDASALGLGAVLAQKGEDQLMHVIAYGSRTTQGAEKNYGATELECLAVVWATEHFRHYLIGRKFRLITDHSALTSLLKMKEAEGKYARWIMRLQEYQFDITYRPGWMNQNADALSRKRKLGNGPRKPV